MVGDIVLTPFPFTDLSATKIRPAVVVAEVGMHDWIVCEVTSSRQLRKPFIAIVPSDMARGSLKSPSRVRPDRLATLNDSVFVKTLGQLSYSKRSEITTKVRSLF